MRRASSPAQRAKARALAMRTRFEMIADVLRRYLRSHRRRRPCLTRHSGRSSQLEGRHQELPWRASALGARPFVLAQAREITVCASAGVVADAAIANTERPQPAERASGSICRPAHTIVGVWLGGGGGPLSQGSVSIALGVATFAQVAGCSEVVVPLSRCGTARHKKLSTGCS